MPRTTSVFAILCACDCTQRFETRKVIFEFSYCIKKKHLAPRPMTLALFKSQGLSMHVRTFIILLLWSVKKIRYDDMQYYTGMKNYAQFKALYDFLDGDVIACSRLNYWGSNNSNLQLDNLEKRGKKRTLLPIDELF